MMLLMFTVHKCCLVYWAALMHVCQGIATYNRSIFCNANWIVQQLLQMWNLCAYVSSLF